jgi:hypothetical protein
MMGAGVGEENQLLTFKEQLPELILLMTALHQMEAFLNFSVFLDCSELRFDFIYT